MGQEGAVWERGRDGGGGSWGRGMKELGKGEGGGGGRRGRERRWGEEKKVLEDGE